MSSPLRLLSSNVIPGSTCKTLRETSVTVPGGQTVVLGTSRPRADRPALILVVRPQTGS